MQSVRRGDELRQHAEAFVAELQDTKAISLGVSHYFSNNISKNTVTGSCISCEHREDSKLLALVVLKPQAERLKPYRVLGGNAYKLLPEGRAGSLTP